MNEKLTCTNCGSEILKHEQPVYFDDEVVCQDCDEIARMKAWEPWYKKYDQYDD